MSTSNRRRSNQPSALSKQASKDSYGVSPRPTEVHEIEIGIPSMAVLEPSPPKGTITVALLSPVSSSLQVPFSASGRRTMKEKVLLLNAKSEELEKSGMITEAEALLREAHNMVAGAETDDKTKVELLAITLNNLGCLEKRRGNIEGCLQYLEGCARLEEKVLHQHHMHVTTQINLSSAFSANREFSQALIASKKAIDILFSKFPGGVDPTKVPRKELVLFGAAWFLFAKAELALFNAQDGKSDRRTAEALQILAHFRNAAHASKDLVGKDDPQTLQLGEDYKKAKEALANHIAVASKPLAGDADPAYPGDNANSMSPRGMHRGSVSDYDGGKPSPKSLHQTDSNSSLPLLRVGSARRTGSSKGFGDNTDSPSGATPRLRSMSGRDNFVSPMDLLPQSRNGAGGSRSGSASRKPSGRLEPMTSPGTNASSAPSDLNVERTSSRNKLPSMNGSESSHRRLAQSNSSANQSQSDHSPLSRRSSMKPLVPMLFLCRELMGIQSLFKVADERKMKYVTLRFIYLHIRETVALFPSYRLQGPPSYLNSIQGHELRKDAMEKDAADAASFSATNTATRIRQQREKVRAQKEIDQKSRDLSLIVLDPSMARRVFGRVAKQRLMLQSCRVMIMRLSNYILRSRFEGWKAHALARKRFRPLKRQVAQILKAQGKNMLKKNFQKWLRFVKMCRQRTAAGLKPRDFEGRRASILQQSLLETGRVEQERWEKEEQEQLERQMEEDRLVEEEEQRLIEASRPPPPRPRIIQILSKEIQTVYDAWYVAETETSSASTGAAAQLDAVKRSFKNTFSAFMTSDDGLLDLERIEGLTEDMRVAEIEEVTSQISPFLVTLICGGKYQTKINEDLVHCLLCMTHETVDFQRVLFDDELFFSVIADANFRFFTILMTTIPGFDISGRFLTELVSLCVKSDFALDFMEIALQNDKVCKFKSCTKDLGKYWLILFDKLIPATSSRGAAQVNVASAQTVYNPKYRMRIITMLERVCLDQITFYFDHTATLKSDKQTLLARLCANGDHELVEIYASLMDGVVCEEQMRRKQFDDSTCIVLAVKSQNVKLVTYLLSTHEACAEKINEKVDGFSSLLEIAKAKQCSDAIISVLKQYGAKDDADRNVSRPQSAAILDDLDGLGSMGSDDYHMMDDLLEF